MASKITNSYSQVDGNWRWPEKTWFRERLNAIKAREQEHRRKPVSAAAKTAPSPAPDDPEGETVKLD